MILMIPVLRLLASRYGVPCDFVGSGRWTGPLLERVSAAGAVSLLSSRRAPYWFNRSQQRLVAMLRARPPGPVYVFEPDEKPLSWLRRAGIGREWICTLRDLPRQADEHILAHALRLASAAPAAGPRVPAEPAGGFHPDPRPTLTETDRHDCAAWLGRRSLAESPLVLIQPGNKKTMKRGDRRRPSNVDYWPETNWTAVIAGVQDALSTARVVICGSPAEGPLAEDIVAQLPPERRQRVAVATEDLPIIRLLALQERAHSMISANTGPAHSAAAMGCPLTVMFTRHPHRAAALYAPVPTTAPVRIVEPVDSAPDAGLDRISPEMVLAGWRDAARP